jgi:hypothetical protein
VGIFLRPPEKTILRISNDDIQCELSAVSVTIVDAKQESDYESNFIERQPKAKREHGSVDAGMFEGHRGTRR